jgi:hypothetical protein
VLQTAKTLMAICFRCKKKFKARKNQHLKYSICPVCQNYWRIFEQGELWVDCTLLLPKRIGSKTKISYMDIPYPN